MYANETNGKNRPIPTFYQQAAFPTEAPSTYGQASAHASSFEAPGRNAYASHNGASTSNVTGHAPQSPASSAAQRQQEANIRRRVPNFYSTNNATGNMQYDPGITATQRRIYEQNRSRAEARKKFNENLGGNVSNRIFRPEDLPQYGQPFERLGVPVQMFTNDMRMLTEITRRFKRNHHFFTEIFDCFSPGPTSTDRLIEEYSAAVNDMSRRYAPYGISWAVNAHGTNGITLSFGT